MDRRKIFNVFTQVFDEALQPEKLRKDSFYEASKTFADNFGFEPYSDYKSFMSVRCRYNKIKKKEGS